MSILILYLLSIERNQIFGGANFFSSFALKKMFTSWKTWSLLALGSFEVKMDPCWFECQQHDLHFDCYIIHQVSSLIVTLVCYLEVTNYLTEKSYDLAQLVESS